MAASFTCPKCGRHGSIKKEIRPGAKVRCLGCQSRFSPELGQETALDEQAASMGAILPELAENKRKQTQPPPWAVENQAAAGTRLPSGFVTPFGSFACGSVVPTA